jgi:NitT/TauT family transport system substrate-binding protein
VAAVPSADSAGLFISLYHGLFARQGLRVRFVPAVSSESVIDEQALGLPARAPVAISCGNYVSYIQAQQAWDAGARPTAGRPAVAADLELFAEGSVMAPAVQGLYTLPGSPVTSLAGLQGRTVGVNAPGNILYLLVASALAGDGVPASRVRFRYVPLPDMAAALRAGRVDAAVLPEPFAAEAAESLGVLLLADLDQGAMTSFPVQGCAAARQWAAAHPAVLAAFRRAFEDGQRIADTSRPAVEAALEKLPRPLGVSKVTAAMMALPAYPVGPVDKVRIQRVADVMRQFLRFPRFDVGPMLGGS